MQTAVQWLEEQIYKSYWNNLNHDEKMNIFSTAKLMEMDQIKSAFMRGDIFGADYYDGINPTDDNYYNETYKSK